MHTVAHGFTLRKIASFTKDDGEQEYPCDEHPELV